MGFRAAWLEHDDLLSVHTEDFIYAVERVLAQTPVNMLLVGVGNGGSLQIWRNLLPEGSKVTAIDMNEETLTLGLDIIVVDFADDEAIRSVLKNQWFDIVIDSTGTFVSNVWPFIRAKGVLLTVKYESDRLLDLVKGIDADEDFCLPNEEIMSVVVFPNVAIVEKRNPRVVPYLEVMTGNKDPIISENFYRSSGVKRITPTPQTVP